MKEAADEAYGHHGVRNGQQFILMCLWDEDGLTPGEIDEEMRRLSERALRTLSPAERAELVRLLDQLHKNLAGG